MNKEIQILWNILAGLLIFCINSWWIWDNLNLLYRYHYTSALWLFMYPDWVLLVNAMLGLVGFLIGVNVMRQKIKIKKAILTDFIILMAGALVKIVVVI